MLVKINTEVLKGMSSYALRASQAVVDASSILDAIVSHDDWYCKEKLKIDAGIKAVKTNALAIKESTESVSSFVVSTANYFIEMVAEEEREMSEIDSGLAEISSILDGPGENVISCGSGVSHACGELRNTANKVEVMNYLSSANKPISIMEYV